jgi:small Trp-rich protein
MFFLVVGLILGALKYFEVGFLANIGWPWLLIPFGIAFFYWEVIDPYFGISKKRASRQIDERKAARIQKLREANHPHLRKGKK